MPRKITAQVVPFSSVVGSSVMLVDENGVQVCTLALMNVSDPQDWMHPDEYRERAEALAQFVADKINGVS